MLKLNVILSACLMSCLFLFSCGDDDEVIKPNPDERIGTLDDLKSGMNTFNNAIFMDLFDKEEENLLISPMSIETALYMAVNGANNNTLDEMMQTLGIADMNVNGLNASYGDLMSAMNQDSNGEMKVANSIWWDDRMNLNDDFKNVMTQSFNADANMRTFNDATKDEINSWAEEKTEGRIKKVLDEISADEVLFLINALYFIADWDNGFDIKLTGEQNFTLSNGTSVQVPTMQSDGQRKAFVTDDYSALIMPFKDDHYSMSFILPKDGSTINDLLANKSILDLSTEIKLEAQEARYLISLPKFEISNKLMLNAPLQRLGIQDAFDKSNADLTNFGTADGNLFITRVLHDTFLKIDEKGAEGAAVTTIGVGTTSLPPSISFNKPFLFYITHESTDAMIFMGKIENPLD